MGCPQLCRPVWSGRLRLKLPEALQEIPRLAIVSFSYHPPRQAVQTADWSEIPIGATKRQYSPNHLEVKGLSPANSMIPGGLTQKITSGGCPIRKQMVVDFTSSPVQSWWDDAPLPTNSPRFSLRSVRSRPARGRIAQKRAEDQITGPAVSGVGHAVRAPGRDRNPGRTAAKALAGRHFCRLRPQPE